MIKWKRKGDILAHLIFEKNFKKYFCSKFLLSEILFVFFEEEQSRLICSYQQNLL